MQGQGDKEGTQGTRTWETEMRGQGEDMRTRLAGGCPWGHGDTELGCLVGPSGDMGTQVAGGSLWGQG